MNTATIVQKLWNYCNVLRDDSMCYGDYPGSSPGQADTEKLTLSLALSQRERGTEGNMADVPACTERQVNPVPEIDWP